MPPRTDGDGPEQPRDDARIVDTIQALSALQEPARQAHTRTRALLDAPDLVSNDSLRTRLGTIADSCELLGPTTGRAITDLVSLLEDREGAGGV